MFETGELPAAVARTVIRSNGNRPSDRWSLANRLIMLAHGTFDARGFRQWQEVGRRVKKGARAFYILAPITKKVVRRVADEETGEEQEEERVVVVGFRGIPVFRYEDTEGDPLPDESYEPPEPPPLFEVARRLGVAVEYRPGIPGVLGFYGKDSDRIVLGSHDPDVFFHELAHAAHHRVKPGGLKGGQNASQEIVAEVVAAALCELYGYPGYLRHAWEYVKAYAGMEPGRALRAVVKLLSEVEAVLKLILAPEGGEEECRQPEVA